MSVYFKSIKKKIEKNLKNKEEAFIMLKKEASILMKFKHPNSLSVLEQIIVNK